MKRFLAVLVGALLMCAAVSTPAYALNTATHGQMSGKTVIAGLLSLIVWPGIGQVVNKNPSGKNITHAIIGLFPPFRFWSGWDALIDRKGGRWDGRV